MLFRLPLAKILVVTGGRLNEEGLGDDGLDPSDASGKQDTGTPTAVVVNATTPTTSIGTESRCGGDAMGAEGVLPAVNAPVVSGTTRVDALTLRYCLNRNFRSADSKGDGFVGRHAA